MDIFKDFTFEAAHRLPNVRPGHKCARLHGHSYKVRVTVSGRVGSHSGWVRDFSDIATAWVPLHAALDHYYLNEIEGLENPTSELLAVWIWDRLVGTEKAPGILRGQLAAIRVRETCTSGCTYRGPAE
jgi:6-pyruvoyltetrahydropterin/6-carboxytetrahydropterin synthase